MSFWGQVAAAVIGAAASHAAAKEQRKQAIADQDNQYVRMRNAAQRAGFNPLTVMRATGGQGFTGLPVISKAAAFGNAAAGIFDAVRQAPIDKYNKEVRDLELKQRKADLELMPMRGKLMKSQIASMNKQEKDDKVYLYERNGKPKLNAYGQHMYVSDAAAEVFPAMQGYVKGDGTTFSAPHEQLLDMGVGGYAAAIGTISAGPKIEQSDASPTAFRYPKLIKDSEGNWTRYVNTFPSNGEFWTQPK
jgi:hypothetical protein